jgi:hypothetical protein
MLTHLSMAEISPSTQDNEGITHLVGAEILDLRFVDVSRSAFDAPDSGYTGYAADGFWYTQGVLDPTHVPFKALWAQEGESDASINRGELDRFPSRIFIVTTASEVVLIDADTLDVWMRFVPFATATAFTYGAFLGDSATAIRQAAFIAGFLVVATDAGLRIADFKNDRAFVLDESAGWVSTETLDARNDDGMLEGSTYPSNQIIDSDCLCVAVGTAGAGISGSTGGISLAAVGSEGGLTAVTLSSSSVSSPQTTEHVSFLQANLGDWQAEDDGDGDSTTPYLVDSSGAIWVDQGIRAGDHLVLTLSDGSTLLDVTVTDVTEDRLTVTPEVDVAEYGSDHDASRPVPSVALLQGGGLVFASGHQLVARVNSSAWYDSSIDPWTGSGGAKICITHESVGTIYRVRALGTGAFVATDLGVFYASDGQFTLSSNANFTSSEFRYAVSGGSVIPTYAVLQGSVTPCVDVVVDAETGHILVAATDGDDCVVTEIDPSIHRAFQFFDQDDFDGTVNCLLSYRNVSGPPDDESGVA